MTELGPEARSLLDDFKEGARVAPDRRAAMRAGIAEKLAAPPAHVTPEAAGGLSVKWIGLAVLALAVTGGTIVLGPRAPAPEREIAAPTSARAPQSVPPAEPEPAAAFPVEAEVVPVEAEVVPVEAAIAPERAVPSAPPRDAEATLREELAVLREADAANRAGRFSTALTLLTRYAQTHTGGQMIEERSAARIVARCGLGANERTQREATRFLTAYPRSMQASRVRRVCGL